MGLVYNDERAGIFAFTDAIDNVNQSFYGLKGHGIVFTSLDDLKGYRIGVHRGTNYANALIQHGGLSVSEVTSDAQNIKKLLLGRISLMLVEVHHIRYLINRQFPDKADKFELVKPPFKVLPLHIAVTKSKYPDHASIVADFNRELKKMHDDGTFARIVKKHESE